MDPLFLGPLRADHETDILTRAVEARVARCRDKIGKGKKGGEII